MQHAGNMSVVFCILVNRVYFQRDATLGTAAISRSRAVLCEILAIQCLRDYGNDVLQLTLAITTNWPLYAGADPVLVARARDDRDEDLEDRIGNAIEMAILCKAKRFIKSSSCQMVIDSIWRRVQSVRTMDALTNNLYLAVDAFIKPRAAILSYPM